VKATRCTTNWSSITVGTTVSAGSTYELAQSYQYWQYSVACVRDTPGDYLLAWTTSDNTGAACTQHNVDNAVYASVTSDALGTVHFITDYGDAACHGGEPNAWGLLTTCAASDSGAGTWQVDYINVPTVGCCDNHGFICYDN
jgi:hypothetical protein